MTGNAEFQFLCWSVETESEEAVVFGRNLAGNQSCSSSQTKPKKKQTRWAKKKDMGGEEKNFQKCPPSRIKAKSLHSDVSRDVGT